MLLSKATYANNEQYSGYIFSVGIEHTTFCTANAMLYHWANNIKYI